MNKPNLTLFFKNTRLAISKHSPEILTGIGIAGMITTTILAVKATPKALRLIEDFEETVCLDHEKIKPIDAVKTCWKCYIPAAVTGTASIACLIGASSVSAKRNAVLATAYKLSETALAEYREKVVETIGEKKEQAVRDAIAKDHIEKNPPSNNVIVMGKGGDTLFYDAQSGRYFYSDVEKIRKEVNNLNFQMFSENTVSLNDFYYSIGLDGTSVGDVLGWNILRGQIDVYFSAQKSPDERPCLAIDFVTAPTYDYENH